MKRRYKKLFIILIILIAVAFSIYKKQDKILDLFPDALARKSGQISASNFLVVDLKTGEKIVTKGEAERIRPASLAKLYSIYMASSLINPDSIIEVRQEAMKMVKSNSSLSNILPGKYYAKNIYHAILAPSGNDATYGLADYLGRVFDDSLTDSKERILEHTRVLNKYLKNHGFNNTYIEDPTGYCDKTYTDLNDLNKLSQALIKLDWFMELVGQSELTTKTPSGKTLTWTNTNKFLDKTSKFYNPNIHGIKTGSLSFYNNIISLYENDKSSYLIILIGSKSDDFRYTDTLNLIDEIEEKTGKTEDLAK